MVWICFIDRRFRGIQIDDANRRKEKIKNKMF